MRMGNYFEVLEMSESVREIHDANSQSCSSQLVKKPNALVHGCQTLARGPNLARRVISFGP